MRSVKLILSLIIVLIAPSYSYSLNHSSSLGALYISLLEGDVQINTEDTGEWVPADTNMPMREGDRIWVPSGGRAELQLRSGTSLRLDEVSSLDLLTLGDDALQVYFSEGHIYVNFRRPQGGVMQIDTPLSSMRVYDNSIFRIDVDAEGNTDISVFKGRVYAEDRNGRTTVKTGNNLSIRDAAYSELSPLEPPDQWEQWNHERDRDLYESRYSSQYLPNDLGSYSYYFDKYGKWEYAQDYGHIWRPTVTSVGWTPYRHGRWVWLGGDYVWISHDPWGWVPHHYGRWAHLRPYGWCWVPPPRGSVYWGPGYVGWVYTHDYVAWVPLAPRDLYYGYGNYGPSSVNIVNVDVAKVAVKRVYANVSVNDAVTVIHRDAFLTGSPAKVTVRKNPFISERISIGRPLIKPERATVMPVLKEVPPAKQPPRKISDLRVDELKHRRPLVREKSAPVLRPQAPQTTMPVRVYKEPKGSESRTFIEKEPTPLKSVQPQQRQAAPDRGRSESETIKKQRETGKSAAERRAPQESQKQLQPANRALQKSSEPRERRFTDEDIKKQKVPARVPTERPAAPVEKQRQVQPGERQMEKPTAPAERQQRSGGEPTRRQQESGRSPAEKSAPVERPRRPLQERQPERSKVSPEKQPAERQSADKQGKSEGR